MTQEKIQALMKLYPLGAVMRKKSGSEWQGRVVGYYSTDLTPEGLAIESSAHAGSVQIYPIKALEVVAAQSNSVELHQIKTTAPTPPALERKPLADEQIIEWVKSGECCVATNDWASHIDFARAIERAHGIGAPQ